MADWTIKKLLSWTEGYFQDNGIDSPRLTAEILLAHILCLRRLDLYLQHDRPLEAGELSDFKTLIKRRLNREPVAYITGKKGFFNHTFQVAGGVLIPRPDTEVLVETAIARLNEHVTDGGIAGPRARVAELGVGSGAIVASVAAACPQHLYFGCDLSAAALGTAKANADAIVPGQVYFFQASWFDAVREDAGFDLILSNPPYIRSEEIKTLAAEITRFEPGLALDGGPDGFDAFRVIVAQSGPRLAPGGLLILEMGYDQKDQMIALCSQYDWVRDLGFVRDLAGHNRLAILKK